MLKRKTAETIPTKITVRGQNETIKFNVTFHNRTQEEVKRNFEGTQESENVADTVLFMVKEWDSEYPLTEEGVKEVENERPGILYAIVEAFYMARKYAREKN
jgi:hypothetical protein